jgi:hypothetical protein
VGFQTAPPSGAGPPSTTCEEPPEPDPDEPELDPLELDPPLLDALASEPPELEPPELDSPASLSGSGFDAGDEPDEPQAVHEANTPSTRTRASLPVAMA